MRALPLKWEQNNDYLTAFGCGWSFHIWEREGIVDFSWSGAPSSVTVNSVDAGKQQAQKIYEEELDKFLNWPVTPKYSLILAAKDIDDGQEVRKVTGSMKFTLRHRLKIYGLNPRVIDPQPGELFLIGDSIGSIKDTQKLAIDFADEIELDTFIKGLGNA